MNKKLKIATAAVSVVMAGTMVFGLFGCGGGGGGGNKGGQQDKYEVGKGDITNVTLNLNIGDNTQRSVSFKYGELISGSVKLPDGKTYSSSSLKPAWEAFQSMVGCKFNDVFSVTSNKLSTAKTATATGSTLADMDIITDSAANVSTYSADLLDISNYLDEMPNYKAFLEANPIVRLSLTSDTKTGAMYYAPYFDGNNDLEKYELFKINWVQSLLDAEAGDETVTYKKHGEVKGKLTEATAVESFMGKTGKYHTDVLDKDGKKLDAGIDVDYDKALAAAKSGALADAVTAGAGKAYTGTSGNIIDIMNFAINESKGAVTGAQLLKIMQEYIKVAYYVGGTTTAFYTQSGYKLSDVFVGNSAAWDVDLYAALGRVLVTNPKLLKSGKGGNTVSVDGSDTTATALENVYLLSARQNNMQRMVDTVSMTGQLYGIRGLESKNIYSYINSKGELQDPRGSEAVYDAMNKLNAFWQEGLMTTGGSGSNGDQSYHGTSGQAVIEALSTYDYVNTQTPAGFQQQGVVSGKYDIEADYNYAPVITPVSKWDEDDSAAIEADEYFRFTESWRTTKDTGFCIPVNNVKSNPAKLQAILKFIDTMFSNDGQIVLTYGPKCSSATAGDGFWYNEEATAAQVTAGTYFNFGGKKLYSTVQYGGVYQPHIVDNVKKAYYGEATKEGVKFDASGIVYAGAKISDISAKVEVKKNADISGDVYVVDSKGKYSKVTGKFKADGFTVTADIAENTDAPTGATYYIDKNGQVLGKDGKKLPLIKNDVNQWTTNATLNYTNFARYVIGSALAIGNKLQSFEFQLTSDMGRAGALVVDNALVKTGNANGIIRHTENRITENKWYIAVPTLLPYTKAQKDDLTGSYNDIYTNGENNTFSNNKNNKTNFFWEIIQNGYNAAKYNTSFNLGLTGTTDAAKIVTQMKDSKGFVKYLTIKNDAWQSALNYYNTKLAK